MKTDKILHKDDVVHPVFLLVILALIGILGLETFTISDFTEGFDLSKLIKAVITGYIIYLLVSIIHISKMVALKNGEIVKGIFYPPFGFVKIHRQRRIAEVKDLQIHQNEERAYEIIAQFNVGNPILIGAVPNRIPAEKKLEKIKTKISKSRNDF